MNRLVRLTLHAALLLAGAALLAPAHAAYPDKPIRWVVPFPPGGAMDGIARALGESLARKFGQAVVVENKPGAGGNLGVDLVAKSPADGYTMVITSIGMVTNRYLYTKLSYDPQKDFVPVSQLAVVPNMLVINPNRVKARTVRELIAEAKAQPGKMVYASAGNGTSIHLAGELFTAMTGTEIMHVPYRGSSPAVTDLLGGQVDMMFDSVASARPHVQSGKLLALGVTTATRSAAMAQVPTLAEAGVPGYALSPWFGVFMPAGTPKEVVRTMHAALTEALKSTEIKARLFVLGAEPIGSTPEAFAATLAAENSQWEQLIRTRGIKAD
ncbi:tripartite tricarboxylate transporter substrate binding protein [Aquabacterium sp. OR-4]|uniref:tripartite tricarboxylate transporter substrate binding protein n=1 Tax=Aquabacterium sp. OR-4 TaxID=2978127 RepID=UPI0028C51F67|nr:tripartite tricarboxylate transporter substrate binding protein [Aquabacterium sp. OR-4]MDT7838568.1 tripartite tricarboxylate transporter substrate binding protein [Aquabacterium sp. OR-4]